MPAINPTTPPKEPVTAKMSRWAANLQFKDLSADAIYQAKRFLLDSLGCALGGYQQRDVKIALEVLDEIAAIGHDANSGRRKCNPPGRGQHYTDDRRGRGKTG